MNLALKIEAVGEIESLGGVASTTLSMDISEESFRDILGKALYQVESQGYAFQTSEVYDSAIANFETLSLRRQLQKI